MMDRRQEIEQELTIIRCDAWRSIDELDTRFPGGKTFLGHLDDHIASLRSNLVDRIEEVNEMISNLPETGEVY